MMTPIEKIHPLVQPEKANKPVGLADANGGFGAVFQSVIDNVKQTDSDLSKAEYLLATGQLDNPADLTIAATKNEIAVSLAIQLRNKAMEAYSEIMRISI